MNIQKYTFFPLAFSLVLSQGLMAKDKNLLIEMSPYVFSKISEADQLFAKTDKLRTQAGLYRFKYKESKISTLSKLVHDNLERCGGFRVVSENDRHSNQVVEKLLRSPPDYQVNQSTLVESWFETIERAPMNEIITHLSSYKTRYYTSPEGIEAMRWISQKWQDLTKNRTDIKVELHKHSGFEQETVILTIQGSENPDKIIILGGHGDSINTDNEGPTSIAPGSDDNAAGIAVLSEILRQVVLHNYRPKNTIQFIAYAAEEVGIRGSYDLAHFYAQQRKNVIGVMQFDGTNYTGQTFDMALIADNTNKAQNLFVASLIDTYLKVSWKYDECHYACSDHAAWNYEGYSASYPVETIGSEQNPYIHTPKDTFDKSNFDTEHAEIFLKLGIAYLIELDQ